MSEKVKVLVVDDDQDIREFLSYNLKKEGFDVETAENGTQTLAKASVYIPDLIILDVMMPDMDGIETCQELRKIESCRSTVITFLSARGEDYSQIAGFKAGADDYIIKPIRPKVLISKVQALLKRCQYNGVSKVGVNSDNLPTQRIRIDREKYVVYKEEEEIFLTRKEFELLDYLATKPEKLFPRTELFNRIWGEDSFVGDRTLDVHIRKLRSKIGEECITTIKGVGYKYIQY